MKSFERLLCDLFSKAELDAHLSLTLEYSGILGNLNFRTSVYFPKEKKLRSSWKYWYAELCSRINETEMKNLAYAC